MSSAIWQDRVWFQCNPTAIVRFRPSSDGEFTPLQALGATPPSFRPSFCRANAPLRWVAVVDDRRHQAIVELLDAISAELLEGLKSEQTPIAA